MKLPNRKGASPRQLNERELHRELRCADHIIAAAVSQLSLRETVGLHKTIVEKGLVDYENWLGNDTRDIALNRITPRRDYSKILLIALCLLLGFGWYTVQLDRDLYLAEIEQGDEKHG